MEFQLPYLALRTGKPVSDSRRIRQRHEMLKHSDSSREELYYYEAQVACLITGYDEWHWTAYCCVDTFFGGEQTVTEYLRLGDDGPSGGQMELDKQTWNPRQYFLRVFSTRLTQVTREWQNITSELEDRLNCHVCASISSLNGIILIEHRRSPTTKALTRITSSTTAI
jgi:hypothetical protein